MSKLASPNAPPRPTSKKVSMSTMSGKYHLTLLARVKVEQIVRWINSLQVGIPITNVFEDLRSGVLLCRILERLKDGLSFKGLNKKAVTKQAAVSNIEKALSVIWKQGVRATV